MKAIVLSTFAKSVSGYCKTGKIGDLVYCSGTYGALFRMSALGRVTDVGADYLEIRVKHRLFGHSTDHIVQYAAMEGLGWGDRPMYVATVSLRQEEFLGCFAKR